MVPRMLLETLIDERGIKRSWLAQRMAVNRSTVTRWAQGKIPVPVERVQELARLTGISLPELLTAIEEGAKQIHRERQRGVDRLRE